jgi:hypothetical protein
MSTIILLNKLLSSSSTYVMINHQQKERAVGIEDQQSELNMEFDDMLDELTDDEVKIAQKKYDDASVDFCEGYENDDDDLMMVGFDQMKGVVDQLRRYVTLAPLEAMTLAHRLVVLKMSLTV